MRTIFYLCSMIRRAENQDIPQILELLHQAFFRMVAGHGQDGGFAPFGGVGLLKVLVQVLRVTVQGEPLDVLRQEVGSLHQIGGGLLPDDIVFRFGGKR